MVGVDVGFENPLFAALEVDYGESDQDSTGEAFNAAEKVSRHILFIYFCFYIVIFPFLVNIQS